MDAKSKYQLNKQKKTKNYKAFKGDDVDAFLGNWINENGCPVPINRIGNGWYMFGSKKIYAKILNG
jgi:hypothetical protein